MAITTRHFGRDTRNGNRIIIVSPFIIGDPHSNLQPNFHKALVVELDSLPGAVQDPLVAIVESERVQDSEDLLGILTGERFPNNQNVIKCLADNKWMYPLDINRVEVTLNRFTSLPLIEWMRNNKVVERYRAKMQERYDFTVTGYSHITGETSLDAKAAESIAENTPQPQQELFAPVDEKLPAKAESTEPKVDPVAALMQQNMAMMQQMSKMTEALEQISSNLGKKPAVKPRGRPKNAQKA